MPDLDQLFDNLLADVRDTTHPPGAQRAVVRARRARTATVAAAVAAVAVLGGLAAVMLGGSDERTSPAQAPRPPSATATSEPATTGSLVRLSPYERAIQEALAEAPGWTATEGDNSVLRSCATSGWARGMSGGAGGTIRLDGSGRTSAWTGISGFRSPARAEAALGRLVDRLAACDVVAWRTEPIPGTEAVMASSTTGVAWLLVAGSGVATFEVPTASGAPPSAVQVEVARLVRADYD